MSKVLLAEETAWLGASGKASLESPPPTVSSLTTAFGVATSSTTFTFAAGLSAAFGASSTFGVGVGAVVLAGEGVGVEMFSTRSRRSMRDSKPASELSPPGRSMRPQISSRIKRGAVAPRIWVKPSDAISAQRDKLAAPMLVACLRIRSS